MTLSTPRRLTFGLLLVLIIFAILFSSFMTVRPASADGLTAGSYTELVNAINAANSNDQPDTINLTGNITTAGLIPLITTTITIEGNGFSVDGGGLHYLFNIEGGNLTINNATITNAYAGNQFGYGAGVYNFEGVFNADNVVFSNNLLSDSEGYTLEGAALFNDAGLVNLNHSTFYNNRVLALDGQLYNNAFGGAIFNNAGKMDIKNTTFDSNQAIASGTKNTNIDGEGGAIFNFTAAVDDAKPFRAGPSGKRTPRNETARKSLTFIDVTPGLTISDSTFFNNHTQAISDSSPANIYSGGSAIDNGYNAFTRVVNTTFSNNSVTAVDAGQDFFVGGGAIWHYGKEFDLKNSIVAHSIGAPNCLVGDSPYIYDFGNNLQFGQPGDDSCGRTIPIKDPKLDPAGLQDNGGPTKTIALQPGSPAIDAADAADCPATDQRGSTRENACDIGAFEFITGPVKNNPTPPPADLIGQLRISPDRLVTGSDSENLVSYIFTIKNIGLGKAGSISFELPVNPNLLVGYTAFNDPGLWVSGVTTTSVTVGVPDLVDGQVVIGTILFRPNTAVAPADGTRVSSRYFLKWTNPGGGSKTVWSNAASFEFGDSNTDVSQGVVQLMTADTPNGTKIVYHSDFWIPDEPVTTWLTGPDGTSKALTEGNADAAGKYSVEVDTAGLAPGTYVVAAHGVRSEEYGSGILVVTDTGATAKLDLNLTVKSLGA